MNGSTTSAPLPLEFNGEVEFEFEVKHPSFGSVHVHSQYKRLKPKVERKEVDIEHIKRMKLKILNWMSQHIDIKGKDGDYIDELTTAISRLSVYMNPFSELDGKPMEIFMKIMSWLWFFDDEIDNAIELGIPSESLKSGLEQLGNILKGKYDDGLLKFESVQNYPFFDKLFHSLIDLHRTCSRDLPDYHNRIGPFGFTVHRFLAALVWFCCDEMDYRYSEATFGSWRRTVGFSDGVAECIALVEGISLPWNIRTSPSLQRLIDIAKAFGAFANDLLGMKKEFQNEGKDNLVVFKCLQKNIPLQQAVNEVCNLLDTELEDFFLIKRAVLKEFSNEPSLIRYIDILESGIDGHNRIYLDSPRHVSSGCIKLSRK